MPKLSLEKKFDREVQSVAKSLIMADNLSQEMEGNEKYKEWKVVLDNAFAIVSDFADKYSIVID